MKLLKTAKHEIVDINKKLDKKREEES